MVLQAFSWEQYYPSVYGGAPFPTRGEMQRMRDLAITHGQPGMLLWYAYNDVLESSDPAGNWANVRAAAFGPHIEIQRRPLALRGPPRQARRQGQRELEAAPGTVLVDGALMRRTANPRTGISLRGLRRGAHNVRVVARDRTGKKAKASQRFKRC